MTPTLSGARGSPADTRQPPRPLQNSAKPAILMQAGTPARTGEAPVLHRHFCGEYSFTATGTRPTPDREPWRTSPGNRRVPSEIWGRAPTPARARRRCFVRILTKHLLPHTQQEIADAVGMAQQSLADRLKVLPDLDKCPKPVKIAARARRRLVAI